MITDTWRRPEAINGWMYTSQDEHESLNSKASNNDNSSSKNYDVKNFLAVIDPYSHLSIG